MPRNDGDAVTDGARKEVRTSLRAHREVALGVELEQPPSDLADGARHATVVPADITQIENDAVREPWLSTGSFHTHIGEEWADLRQ